MKNPFFVGRPPEFVQTGAETVDELLTRTGGNTGNFLFIHSLRRVIPQQTPKQRVKFEPRRVREEHDGLIVPAANWLNGHSDWGGLATKIEASKLPCVIVGLGAQSQSVGSYPQLTVGTERLIRVISERSNTLSVRRAYTATVLERYGVKNVTVTGCPSLLWHVDRPASVERKSSAPELISVCGTRANSADGIREKGDRTEASLLLSREAFRRGYDYVAQTEVHDIRFALDRFDDVQTKQASLAFLKDVYGESSEARLTEYLRAHVKVFFRIPDWLDYLRTRDFMIGTRLHGVIASLIAGIPALLVTHDTRTDEAARHMGIPAISAGALLAQRRLDVTALYDAVDLDAFNRRMPGYFADFAAFFRKNDVQTRLEGAR